MYLKRFDMIYDTQYNTKYYDTWYIVRFKIIEVQHLGPSRIMAPFLCCSFNRPLDFIFKSIWNRWPSLSFLVPHLFCFSDSGLKTVRSGPVRSGPGRSTVPHGPRSRTVHGPRSRTVQTVRSKAVQIRKNRTRPTVGPRGPDPHGTVRSGPNFFFCKLKK
jgi:hypothetical protein